MSIEGERLWPKESEQPAWQIEHNGDLYNLQWDNTWIQRYRTGRPEFDERLKKFDHVLHTYIEDGDEEEVKNYLLLSFEDIGAEGMTYLHANYYRHHVDPIPEYYALHVVAAKEGAALPDYLPDNKEENLPDHLPEVGEAAQ